MLRINLFIKKVNNSKAFSVLEMIIAIAIISIGLLGLVSLGTQNTRVGYINKNSLTASMLAQEGLELVRNNRDNNWRSVVASWSNNLIGDGDYVVDYTGFLDDSVDNIDEPGARLYLDSNGFYVHNNTGKSTPFFRLITVVDKVDYIIVLSQVKWAEGSNIHTYTAETRLYNWW